jgi:peptide deformylase
MKFRAFIIIISMLLLASCDSNRLIISEKRLINSGSADSAMYVLSVFNHDDSLILRKNATNVPRVGSKHIQLLGQRMLSTVQHPNSLGVGIAAPQVGISRRLILVQRFDKEGEPFEVYFNPLILAGSDEMATLDEGCLSIPGYRGPVERPYGIKVKYLNEKGEEITETVEGFTARIFQHEIDHLNGMLYTDLLKSDSLFRKME